MTLPFIAVPEQPITLEDDLEPGCSMWWCIGAVVAGVFALLRIV